MVRMIHFFLKHLPLQTSMDFSMTPHSSFDRSTYAYDGCYGGFTQTGYEYVAKAGGITYEDFYPYYIPTTVCDTSKNDYAVTVTMSYRVDGEAAMVQQVLAGRTLSVSLDANNMGNYRSGIYRGCSVDYNVNHAVNIIGVNVTGGYWIIRNSWGTWWGDNGYMKIAMVRNIVACMFYALYDFYSCQPVEHNDFGVVF
jgi:cathepsin L